MTEAPGLRLGSARPWGRERAGRERAGRERLPTRKET